MCGIAGKLFLNSDQPVDRGLMERMLARIEHRGPDGQGTYFSGPVALGHRRLAIIDLSTGDQPMTNENGTVWLVYNGEVYNFPELRKELVEKGHTFRSTSDTEVIIHLYEEYGPECVKRLQGMFAFALWDDTKKLLFLARDRLGIKPLYYTCSGKALLFASEVKSLLCDPEVPREVNTEAIHRFLTFLFLPGDQTLVKGIQKLEPGHYLVVKDGQVTCRCYWDLQFHTNGGGRDLGSACEELRGLLRKTVREHMISDVPVGVLLSGGVDSTVVLSCAVQETSKRINTFTIGFEGEEFDDERPFARLAAKRFGTEHHELTISPKEFCDFLPAYVRHMEEPVCEAPAIALYYVSRLARKHVTVVLSGEGGDEAFGGYQTYRNLLALEGLKRAVGPLKGVLGTGLGLLGGVNARFKKYGPLCNMPLQSYYYSRVASPLSYFNSHRQELCTPEFYQMANTRSNAELVNGLFNQVDQQAQHQHVLNRMLYVDTKTWLPDDLLIKADKMTMANSLELRVPLLDHLVLEFAAKLPPDFKVKGWTTKRILKEAFKDLIPPEIINRRKTGLPVPVRRWMQQDLVHFVEDVLLSKEAIGRGYFRRAAVNKLVRQNLATGLLTKELFSLLTLELWHQNVISQSN